MKFHCPECNAKYRISEDKIAGRPNAKLRCKQCSHLFLVREAIEREERNPTVSIAPSPPAEALAKPKLPAPDAPTRRGAALPQPRLVARAGAGPVKPPAPPRRGNAVGSLAAVGAGKPRPRLPKPSLPPPPSALAEDLSVAEPEERSSAVDGRPEQDRVSALTPDVEVAPESVIRGSTLPQAEAPATDDLDGWFVEAEGQPEGPLTASALRQYVSTGVVDQETLVWRAEVSEWKAASLVEAFDSLWGEARTRSKTAEAVDDPVSVAARAESAKPRSRVAEVGDSALASTEAESAESPTEKSRVADLLRDGTAGPTEGDEPPAEKSAEGEAQSAIVAAEADEQKIPEHSALQAKPPPGFGSASSKRASPAVAPKDPSRLSAVSFAPSYVPPKPGKTVPSALAWGGAVVGIGFGFGLGFLVFGQTEPEIRYVDAPSHEPARGSVGEHAAPPPPRGAAGPNQAAAAKAPAAGEPRDLAAAVARNQKSGSDSPSKGAVAAPTEPKGGSLLSGLGRGSSGPAVGGGSRPSGGPSLTATQIQRAVQRYQPGVRRSCWQRSLNSRALGAPTTARVSVTIKIAAGGSVTGVSTSGDPSGYPGLARCIQGRVRGWKFPSAGGGTTTKVPFVFAAQ